MRIAVIGGGASGFFGAIRCASLFPHHEIHLYEKSTKFLSKVLISGGGRCNVSNVNFDKKNLNRFYPRGHRFIEKAFMQFNHLHTYDWFEKQGIKLKTESDGRIFPQSNRSITIADCLIHNAQKLGILLHSSMGVKHLSINHAQKIELVFEQGETQIFDKVLISSGGNPKLSGFEWLKALGHQIVPPVPSLFTFNVPQHHFSDLMGISVQKASIKIKNTSFEEKGILLITHWGFSGPAVIRLSSWAALELSKMNYLFEIQINWTGGLKEHEIRAVINEFKTNHPKKTVLLYPLFGIARQLWEKICYIATIEPKYTWQDLPKKPLNKLVETLQNQTFEIKGKTTFKEEFVTAGGINTNEIDVNTMESKLCKGVFFSGEIINIDGITGGYNFQAAWTTGYIAGSHIGLNASI
jgi:hypothetical protein